jgi:geranylgeranyl transferase type-2 subunit beta
MIPYLQQLLVRLASGIAQLPEEQRDRHCRWILGCQEPDGGFAGRHPGSDLYYTSFALRSLALLGGLNPQTAARCGSYLRTRLHGFETILDTLSLLYSGFLLRTATGTDVFADLPDTWRGQVARGLEALRASDGGYSKSPQGYAGSTYHSFLVLLALELLEVPTPEPERLVSFLLQQRAADGGFLEIRVAKRAGTNPTAAAIGALEILGALTEEIRRETIDFLADMQTDEGGLRANSRIPVADLLSTFTGLWTLERLGARDAVDLRSLKRYVLSLESEHGGFAGAVLDSGRDVEYTFYGIATLGLVADV